MVHREVWGVGTLGGASVSPHVQVIAKWEGLIGRRACPGDFGPGLAGIRDQRSGRGRSNEILRDPNAGFAGTTFQACYNRYRVGPPSPDAVKR
jgi:hypothetical protein